MSRWLEQRSAWQYFVIAWAIGVSAALTGALLFRGGQRPHANRGIRIPFGSLIAATGATLGRQIRKRAEPKP